MTIRLRLTLYWAAVLGAILLLAAIAAAQLFERQQWAALDAALLEEAETTAEEIQRGPAHAPEVVERLSKEADLGPGRRVRLVTARETVADAGDTHTVPPQVGPALPAKSRILRGHAFRFAVAPLSFAGQPACLLSGIAVTSIAASIARMQRSLLLTVPIVLLLCVAGGYWLAGRALRPIEAIRSDLDAIGPLNLSSRLANPPVADEVARLIRVINALLERLERASATERRFASDAAHELRTPLAILRTGMEVALARERTAEDTRAALALAHREVLSLCKIADELLMLARLGGEVAVDRTRLNLRELVADIASTVEPLAEARRVRLMVAANADVHINGNDAHLRRLLINLLDNALKFTPEGGSIEVAVSPESGRATIRVADTGPGIPPDEMPLIFNRFYRGAHVPHDGSGLGLSLCREIARLHGGEIVVRNRSSGGCEFVVTLPLSDAEPNRAAAAGGGPRIFSRLPEHSLIGPRGGPLLSSRRWSLHAANYLRQCW